MCALLCGKKKKKEDVSVMSEVPGYEFLILYEACYLCI